MPTVREIGKKRKRQKKAGPLKQHPDWLVYFELSARNELSEALYQQVERGGEALLQAALDGGWRNEKA